MGQNERFSNFNLQILSSNFNLRACFVKLFNFKLSKTCWKSSKTYINDSSSKFCVRDSGRTNKIIFKVSVWSDAQHCSLWTRNFWTISFPPLVRNIEKWHISSLSTFRHFCGKRKHFFSELPQSLIGSWLLSQPYMFHVFGKNFSTESKY